MKTLAICLSGSLRSLEYTINNFKETIINPNKNTFNILIFLFTPDDDFSNKIDLYKENGITIFYIIKKDVDIKLPNINFTNATINKKTDKCSGSGLYGYIQQLYGVKKLFDIVQEYEKFNNISIDYLCRMRTDVIFREPYYFNNYDIDNYVIIPNFHYWDGINDRFAIGTYKNMSVYMNMFTNIYNPIFNNILNMKAEAFCKLNLIKNHINYKMEPILFKRIRANGIILNDC